MEKVNIFDDVNLLSAASMYRRAKIFVDHSEDLHEDARKKLAECKETLRRKILCLEDTPESETIIEEVNLDDLDTLIIA